MSKISTNDSRTKLPRMLMELSIPVHRVGYLHLRTAIPIFQKDKRQSMISELYPAVAKELGYPDWGAVEHAMREVIKFAWKHRNQEAWDKYFPGCRRAPSNKQFIATLAEYL